MASKKAKTDDGMFVGGLPEQLDPKRVKPRPPMPLSTWVRPLELPDLRGVTQIALDTEGKDEGLSARQGSSWPWRGGHISGVSVAWREGERVRSFYAPVNHPDSDNFDLDQIKRWVKDHSHLKIICHNCSHDWGWLSADWQLPVGSNLADTAAMAMMVDEDRQRYSLDECCNWRGITGKNETIMKEFALAKGWKEKEIKSHIHEIPAEFIGDYAEQDVRATLLLAESLWVDIEKQGLGKALALEHNLIPMCIAMRRRGVRVDTNKAEAAHDRLIKQRDEVLARLTNIAGYQIGMEEIRSPFKLKAALDQLSIPWEHRTEKAQQPQFTAELMKKHNHEFVRLSSQADGLTDDADKFFKEYILSYERNGRIHATINQYRNEEGGTKSYRFSYSDPPLQQAPARDNEMAKEWRGCFEPEEDQYWLSADYSQQEYRLIVHYAAKRGLAKAQESAAKYAENPKTDFHQMVADWTGLGRKRAKDCNFAKAYGAGIPQFAGMANLTQDEAQRIMDQYDRELPFVKQLSRDCQSWVSRNGYIDLLDGARCRFDKYEPANWERVKPLPRDEAERMWGHHIRRAGVHKAMNRLIQGGAARQTKMWMLACWKEGILPLIQMHDELDFSIEYKDDATIEKICQLGRDVYQLLVPMAVDTEVGENWGDVKALNPDWAGVVPKRHHTSDYA